MKHALSVTQLSCDPCQPGRWWLHLSSGGKATVDWMDCIAAAAQPRRPGRVAVLDIEAVMISNVRVWENLILPLWYREGGALAPFEEQVSRVLALAGLPEDQQEKLMGRQPSALDRGERRLMVLLRALLLEPSCVIVEEEFWRDMLGRGRETTHGRVWHALQCVECMVVVAGSETPEGWKPVVVQED